METIRLTPKIPGMSTAVVRDQELIWASGFGYSDLENKVAATPDIPYGFSDHTGRWRWACMDSESKEKKGGKKVV